jgi:hypothetical protein
VFGPNLKGFGNFPSATHRQIVAGLTGKRPSLFLVVATTEIRPIRCFMIQPKTQRQGMRLVEFFANQGIFVTCSSAI